jgi:N-ethylmaleimide reductase
MIILDEVINVFGADRTGTKLSVLYPYNDMSDSNPLGLLNYLIDQLNKRNVTFIEVSELRDSNKPV